jgi:hypothetical protein
MTTKRTIRIFAAEVTAEMVGRYFAVHPTPPINARRKGYSCTHVPTGCQCGESFLPRAVALALARALKNSGCDWQFTDPHKMPRATKTKASRIVNRIMEQIR